MLTQSVSETPIAPTGAAPAAPDAAGSNFRDLLRAMASALEIGGATYHWLDRDKVWHAARANEAGFEIDARGLH